VNHTLEHILAAARADAEIAVIGPTASLLPDALFARGVRVVGGVRVKKPDELLDVLAAGGSGYHFFDKLAPRMVMENMAFDNEDEDEDETERCCQTRPRFVFRGNQL
jgi:uncharacterized protein (DUF4213/DUF364 family)